MATSRPKLAAVKPYVGRHRLVESERDYPCLRARVAAVVFVLAIAVLATIGFDVAPPDPAYVPAVQTVHTSTCVAPGWVVRSIAEVAR